MKLSVILNSLFDYDGKHHGAQTSTPVYFRYLKPYFDEIAICAPTKKIEPIGAVRSDTYSIISEDFDFKLNRLPPWHTHEQFLCKLPLMFNSLYRIYSRAMQGSDVIWIRLPDVAALISFPIARKIGCPIILHYAANVIKGGKSPKYTGLRRPLARLSTMLLDGLFKHMASQAQLVLATGRELFMHYAPYSANIIEFIDTLIEKKDLYVREDTCKSSPIKVLYVGRFIHGKGIPELISAISLLVKNKFNIHVFMVGTGPLEQEAKNIFAQNGLSEIVTFKGFIPMGPDLLEIYRSADIFVLPTSSYPEGLPRVILEAMSSSLPVIATKIGGVPGLVSDGYNGLLIEPGNNNSLALGIKRVITDTEFRRHIIANAFNTASSLTVEAQTELVLKNLWV